MHIETIDQLRDVYISPKARALKKQLSSLDVYCQRYIALSPFVVLSSSGGQSGLDASPRGGAPGFVKVLDPNHLLIPDSPGNNRLDTLENVISTGQLGMLFLIPGMDETLRVNGRASLHTDAHFLDLCASEIRRPKLVIRVAVHEAYLHCAKAFMRSKLWDTSCHVERQLLPTMNEMISEQTGTESEPQQETLKRYLTEL